MIIPATITKKYDTNSHKATQTLQIKIEKGFDILAGDIIVLNSSNQGVIEIKKAEIKEISRPYPDA